MSEETTCISLFVIANSEKPANILKRHLAVQLTKYNIYVPQKSPTIRGSFAERDLYIKLEMQGDILKRLLAVELTEADNYTSALQCVVVCVVVCCSADILKRLLAVQLTKSDNYGVATVSRIDYITGLFCRIRSLL